MFFSFQQKRIHLKVLQSKRFRRKRLGQYTGEFCYSIKKSFSDTSNDPISFLAPYKLLHEFGNVSKDLNLIESDIRQLCLCKESMFFFFSNDLGLMKLNLLRNNYNSSLENCFCFSVLHGREPYHKDSIENSIESMHQESLVVILKKDSTIRVIFEGNSLKYQPYGDISSYLILFVKKILGSCNGGLLLSDIF